MLPAQDGMSSSYPNSMPTPPFSPQAGNREQQSLENNMRTTENLLDSLVSFYQQERMWVYRTRAQLEDMQDSDPSDCSTDVQLGESSRHMLTLPSPSMSSASSTAESADSVVEPRRSTAHSASPPQPSSRWARRKQAYKLRLDLSSRNKRSLLEQSAALHRAPSSEGPQPSVRILEMYDSMMEMRMESCQRINKLIRNANRAHLNLR